MKSVGKAAELLRKAAAALRGKAGVLRARLLFLASLRRRAAVVAGISRHICALAPRQQKKAPAARRRCRALAPAERADAAAGEGREAAAAAAAAVGLRDCDGGGVVGLSELASLFEEVDGDGDGGGYTEWTLALQSLFDDDGGGHGGGGGGDEQGAGDLMNVVEAFDEDVDDVDEPSVIDVIRCRREVDGREFRIEDEIDAAADMFIKRVRRRIAAQPELVASCGFHY
ncbi:hypothetical protein ACP4OV_005638 [Aristida adscensionis]